MEPISIWEPTLERDGTVFVRPPQGPLGDHYPARRRLTARKAPGVRRICWLGESAAAGYLYAPHLTPAGVLESMLARAVGQERYEVIDLARTNETLAGLVETARTSMQLSPDLLVIYAGNNWNLLETPELSPYYPSAGGRMAVAEALREEGVMGVVELAGRARLAGADRALTRLAEIAGEAAVPVMVVVPEVNLADWESRQPVAWLPGDGSRRWHRLCRSARVAAAGSHWSEVLRRAAAMLELDGGTCPTTYRLLARALAEEGEAAAARGAAEAEVGCHQYPALCFLGAPQASAADQQLLREAARRLGFSVVDLPKLFAEHTANPLPGRRLFLDYCHLTSEGMAVVAAGVAAEILRLETREVPRRDLLGEQAPTPPPGVEALGRIGGAIHTAHRMLPVTGDLEIVAYWLDAALDASPGATDSLMDLASARIAPLPEMMTPAGGRNLERPFPLGYQHGWRYEHLDLALLAELRRVLARRAPGRVRELDESLLRHHDVETRPRDLIRPPVYLWEPLARFHPEVAPFADVTERAVLRSPWPVSELGFVASGSRTAVVEIEARLPTLGRELDGRRGRLEVLLDGRLVGSLLVGCAWSRARIPLPAKGPAAGIHRLSLRWPELPAAGEAALAAAVTRLERGLEADIHPVFGELHSVRVGAERS